MVAEEDNFDIDIYGDGGEDYQQDQPDSHDVKVENTIELPLETDAMASHNSEPSDQATGLPLNASDGQPDIKVENGEPQDKAQKIASTDDSAQNPVHLPKQAPQTQGLKRQDGADDRFVEPGATPALFISELHWWVTDDDVRGWANQSECEDELVDMTFSEHKVNGKSKGYVSNAYSPKLVLIPMLDPSQPSVCPFQIAAGSDSCETKDRIFWRRPTVHEKVHSQLHESLHESFPHIAKRRPNAKFEQ